MTINIIIDDKKTIFFSTQFFKCKFKWYKKVYN